MSLDVASSHLQDKEVNMKLDRESLIEQYEGLRNNQIHANYDPFYPYLKQHLPKRSNDLAERALSPMADIGGTMQQVLWKNHIDFINQNLQGRRFRKPSEE